MERDKRPMRKKGGPPYGGGRPNTSKPDADKRYGMKGKNEPWRKDHGNRSGEIQKRRDEIDARRLALNALSDVMRAKAYSTLALGEHLRKSTLSPEDKRLATSIFYTTIENLIHIDFLLAQFVERMPEPFIEDVLRIAVAQIVLMDKIPDHAAVDEAVKQAKRFGRDGFTGMINGTLRNLIRARDAGTFSYPDKDTESVRYLSIMHSVPEALSRRLIDQYGMDFATQIISYRPQQHVETVRVNMVRMNTNAFEAYAQKRGWKYEKTAIEGVLYVKNAGDLSGDPDFRNGVYSIQGMGSILAALAVEPVQAGQYLDACAAPGGKTALICEKLGVTGRVQAWDIHAHRVELLQAVKSRLRLDNMRPMERDATILRPELEDTFDGVLVDAPCSGLGVMIDKPDIKYRVTDGDIASVMVVQKNILDTCCKYVIPGGLLVYSTCTVLKEENEEQIAAFLEKHPEFSPETDCSYLPDSLKPLCANGMIQLHAHRDGMEGFFIARLRKRRI